MKLLASLRAHGFYVVVGVPNTTHVTQPTDQNYGYFKLCTVGISKRLVEFCRARKNKGQQSDFPLLIFGKNSANMRSDLVVLEHAFDTAFAI